MALDNSNTLGFVSNSPRTRAVRHLIEWTQDGRLPAGQRLPSENRLAAKLNVSRTTIRLALDDLEKQGIISSEKRRRIVLSHIKPNRTFLSDAIALITDAPEQFNRSAMHGTWHSNFIHTGAVDAIRAAGYDALTIHPNRVVGDLLQRLISEKPRGVIIMRRAMKDESSQYFLKAFREGNIPFVIYGDIGLSRSDPRLMSEIDMVISDHETGAQAITKWLIQKGCKRILRLWKLPFHGPEERQNWLQRRDQGYEKSMKEAGLEVLPPVEIYETEESQIAPNSKEYFDLNTRLMAGYLVEHLTGPKPIDAIMAISDSVVGYVSAALRVHGKQPNRDILIAGYDNMWDDQSYQRWEPGGPAVTVDKQNLLIGRELMSLLQERIDGKLFEAGQRRIVTPELVIRPSALADSGNKSSPQLTK
ncbi:hypothetical protein BH09VER1_BH09VER1_47240 [soil metagenome]